MTAAPDGVVANGPVGKTDLYIQAGAFVRYDNANRVAARLHGLPRLKVSSVMVDGKEFFRVRAGPVRSLLEADGLLERVIASGYPNARIIVD